MTRRLGSKRTSGDHPDYSIIKNGQNTEQSPGDLLSFKFQGKTSANAGVKNSKKSIIIIMIIFFTVTW